VRRWRRLHRRIGLGLAHRAGYLLDALHELRQLRALQEDLARAAVQHVLLSAAADCKVQAVVAGHTHQQLTYEALVTRRDGEGAIGIPVHCSGATTGLGPDAKFSSRCLMLTCAGMTLLGYALRTIDTTRLPGCSRSFRKRVV
jgi:hypothetical protein